MNANTDADASSTSTSTTTTGSLKLSTTGTNTIVVPSRPPQQQHQPPPQRQLGRSLMQAEERQNRPSSSSSKSSPSPLNSSSSSYSSSSSSLSSLRRNIKQQTHPARRRLQFWIQQTWRGIPPADFGSSSCGKARMTVGPAAITANDLTTTNTNPNTTITTNTTTKTDNSWPALIERDDKNSSTVGSSQSSSQLLQPQLQSSPRQQQQQQQKKLGKFDKNTRRPHSNNNLSMTTTTTNSNTVSNVDEALNVLSFYNNDEYFPPRCLSSNDDDDDDDDDDDCYYVQQHPFDWILDGHPEWYDQYSKTQTLLNEMADSIPALSSTMTKDDEEKFLWQMLGGGVKGQQELQFATFPNIIEDDNNVSEPIVVMLSSSSKLASISADDEIPTSSITSFDDKADHSNKKVDIAVVFQVEQMRNDETKKEQSLSSLSAPNLERTRKEEQYSAFIDENNDNDKKQYDDDGRDNDRCRSIGQSNNNNNNVDDDNNNINNNINNNNQVDEPAALSHSQSTSTLPHTSLQRRKPMVPYNHGEMDLHTDMVVDSSSGPSTAHTRRPSLPNSDDNPQQQQSQQRRQQQLSDVAVDAAAAAAVLLSSSHHHNRDEICSPSQTQDFERFWDSAVTAPTPDGTWDSLDSRSTYQTPSLSEAIMIRTMTAATTTTATATTAPKSTINSPQVLKSVLPFSSLLNQGQQQQKQEEQQEQLQQSHDVIEDDDDDFGDFQEATPTITVEKPSPSEPPPMGGSASTDNSIEDRSTNEGVVDIDERRQQRPTQDPHDTIALDGIPPQTGVDTESVNLDTEKDRAFLQDSIELHPPTPPRTTLDDNNHSQDNENHIEALTDPLQQIVPSAEATQRESLAIQTLRGTPIRPPSALMRSPTSPFKEFSPSNSFLVGDKVAGTTTTTSPAVVEQGLSTPCASPPSIDGRERSSKSHLEPPTPITKNYSSPDVRYGAALNRQNSHVGCPSISDPQVQDETWSRNHGKDEDDDDDSNDDDDEDGTRAESLLTDDSNQSSSIPSVVQLFTKSVQPHQPSGVSASSIVVPQTVRLASTTTTTNFSSSFYFGASNKSIHRTSSLTVQPFGVDLDDEPSIASSLASPEVKFLRRKYSQQHVLSPDSVNDENDETTLDDKETMSLGSLATLPEQYWKYPELDHTLQELKKLEWDWLPYWQMGRLLDEKDAVGNDIVTDTVSLLQEQITQRLSALDSFYGKVCKRVYRKIQPHMEELVSVNHASLDLCRNLQLAQMYLSKSQKSIQLAKNGTIGDVKNFSSATIGNPSEGVGVLGATQILGLWDTQASYRDLSGALEMISGIYNLEREIIHRMEIYDPSRNDSIEECRRILQLVQELKSQLTGNPARHLDCFSDLRRRVDSLVIKTFSCRLHSCLEMEAAKCCLSYRSPPFDHEVYKRLIEAMLLVRASGSDEEKSAGNSFEGAFCTSIHTAALLEVQKAFGRSLLEPTDSEYEETDFEQELMTLGHNLTLLDSSRISVWTHNLVTIRFDLEIKRSKKLPLPAVFHKQCWTLANVLHGMLRLIDWHLLKFSESQTGGDDESKSELLGRIHVQLRNRRASVWNACVQSLEECLEEYMKTTDKKNLFQWVDETFDDTNWFLDLEGLEDVAGLIDQFLSLGKEFLDGIPVEFVNDGSMIRDKFHSVLDRHLRTVHVEAMNTMGNALHREKWKLIDIIDSSSFTAEDDPPLEEQMFTSIVGLLSQRKGREGTINCRSKQNRFGSVSKGRHLSLFVTDGNPFDTLPPKLTHDEGDVIDVPPKVGFLNGDGGREVVRLMKALLERNGSESFNSTTSCIADWLIPWTSRLLVMSDKLPSMCDAVGGVIKDLFDLYLTTVFRLCAGNSVNERILLGLDELKPKGMATQERMVRVTHRASSPHFGFVGLRSQAHQKPSRPLPTLSRHVEAELSALVPGEYDCIQSLQGLIVGAQKNLQGVAKLDLVDGWIIDPPLNEDTIEEEFARETVRVLEKREAACWSYVSLAIALYAATLEFDQGEYPPIKEYCDCLMRCLPLLICISSRISCMRAIRGRTLVKEILSVGGGWEESKLHESPNEYVEYVCDFMALLWYNLTATPHKLPPHILRTIWGDLVGGGYMVLLDAFSKVPFCSTEGRSLMSMDLASYASGTRFESIASRLEGYPQASIAFPDFSSYRSMAYVDTYVKLFYFPAADAMDWIESNFREYHQAHMIALALSTATNEKEAGRMISRVVNCYVEFAGRAATTTRI